MKYYYEKPENWVGAGEIYECDHPMYHQCTLFRSGPVGLAIIREKFDPIRKTRRWSSIEPWIAGDIYLNKKFEMYFIDHARAPDENGLYPTYTVRQVMWALRMKPLKKEYWEAWNDS